MLFWLIFKKKLWNCFDFTYFCCEKMQHKIVFCRSVTIFRWKATITIKPRKCFRPFLQCSRYNNKTNNLSHKKYHFSLGKTDQSFLRKLRENGRFSLYASVDFKEREREKRCEHYRPMNITRIARTHTQKKENWENMMLFFPKDDFSLHPSYDGFKVRT